MSRKKADIEMNPYINFPVDKKSRQVVNTEIPVAQLGRTKLKGAEPFNEQTANAMLLKHLKKKKKESPAIFLLDRIRFTKKGFHEYLSYREIQNFHRFPNHPDKFMLFVVEEKKGARSYESYGCTNPSDVLKIRELISAAQNDPKRLLQDSGPTRMLSVSSSSSSEYYIENRVDRRYSRQVPYYTDSPAYITEQPQYVVQTEPRAYYRSTYSRPSSLERVDVARVPSVRASQVYEAPRVAAPPNDVTYLRSDNINGPQIMERGPVYMYVSRSRQNLNRNSWSPETSRAAYY